MPPAGYAVSEAMAAGLYTSPLRWKTRLQRWFTAREEEAIMYT